MGYEKIDGLLLQATGRTDLEPELFQSEFFLQNLRNSTPAPDCLEFVLTTIYPDLRTVPLSESVDATDALPEYLRVAAEHLAQIRQESPELAQKMVSAGTIDFSDVDVMRAVDALREAADQHYNYAYHDTSLMSAYEFAGFLVGRAVFERS